MTKKNQEPAPQNNNNNMSQHEVAEALGIKRQAVNNIEKKALRKLKYIITRKYKKEDFL
jgi:DNA-directed RNA polymerase sigma subunit (sigma70/sigma32)